MVVRRVGYIGFTSRTGLGALVEFIFAFWGLVVVSVKSWNSTAKSWYMLSNVEVLSY